MNPLITIPIIVGVFTAILGYVLGRMVGVKKEEFKALENKNAKLEAELKEYQKKLNIIEVEDMRMASAMKGAPAAFNASEAKSILGRTVKENDMTVIEGMGPTIQALFQKHGIHTWKTLSETSVEKCEHILDSEGKRFVAHIPDTWPKQAKLAFEGKWKQLKDWQDKLVGGKVK